MVSLISLLVLTILNCAITIMVLRACAQWLKSAHATWRRSFLVIILLMLVGVAFLLIELGMQAAGFPDTLVKGVVLLVLQLAVVWSILGRVFALSKPKTWALWGLFLAWHGIAIILVLLLVRPYVVEAVLVPTNSMAPTILGWHRDVACSKCGGPAIVSVTFYGRAGERAEARPEGICTKCRSVATYPPATGPDRSGDRLMISKLRKPQRWDVVAYWSHNDSPTRFAHRLVGLPGETLFIEDGAVWIDGRKLDLPPHLAALAYASRAGLRDDPTRDQPFTLSDDECYVLGDFSMIAFDSRFSGPTKWKDIIGVADLLYWPPGRAGLIR